MKSRVNTSYLQLPNIKLKRKVYQLRFLRLTDQREINQKTYAKNTKTFQKQQTKKLETYPDFFHDILSAKPLDTITPLGKQYNPLS